MRFSQTEAIMGLNEQKVGIWRLSLEHIEATAADHLGRGRVPGNQPGPCFSRQVAMYLAKNVAGWSTTRIGAFTTAGTTLPCFMPLQRSNAFDRLTKLWTH